MSETEATPATAHKARVLTDAYVRIEFTLTFADQMTYDRTTGHLRPRTAGETADMLEAKCREFEEFVRDHRSQDPVALIVVREFQDQCSACGRAWEVWKEADAPYCASCGAPVDREAAP